MISILFLGDSYTIGEGVPLFENYPSRLIQMLRQAGTNCTAPEIIAKTGWTTDELISNLNHTRLQPSYDYVTLLIGVNNEYRGHNTIAYHSELEYLVEKSLSLCKNENAGVFILNIPDYSCTPFVVEENKRKVSERINEFNHICNEVAQKYKTTYIDVCSLTRAASENGDYLAEDKLHYSVKAYDEWAKKIFDKIKEK